MVQKQNKSRKQKTFRGAGIFFICTQDNTALFLKRSADVMEPGTWGIPGGSAKPEEKLAETAKRETVEEITNLPRNSRVIDSITNKGDGWRYKIFIVDVPLEDKDAWTPRIKINYEHTGYNWFPLAQFPDNLHSVIQILQT